MKKSYTLLLILLISALILFTACEKYCVHAYDENLICRICGNDASTDKSDGTSNNGDSSGDVSNEKLSCTVKFDTDGGTEIAEQTVEKGGKAQKPADPTKDGYIFEGWYVDDEKWSFAGYVVTEDMTITAKWSPILHEVRFVDENGELITTSYVRPGEKLTAPKDPIKSGCSFIGWFNNGIAWSFDDSVVTKDMTLTTKWIAYVVYRLDGGSNSSKNPTAIYSDDELPIELSDPKKDGYTFLGWYSDNGFGNRVTSITSCTSHVFYALWSSNDVDDEPEEGSKTPWKNTTLKMQLTDNSNNEELPPSSRRYLAGDLSALGYGENASTIDDYIEARNDAAEEETNVKLVYEYLPNTQSYSWGQNIDRIDAEVRSNSATAPDIYCNFVYDMVSVSLKGAFANLHSTTMYEEGHKLAGKEHNYFEFAGNFDYFDTGKGYMYDYMRSLTLSKSKIYCLASDYFIDVVRAFMAVPVNIKLLETLDVDNSTDYLNDRVTTFDENGYEITKYTIDDLCDLAFDGEWTYETLAKFSAAITEDDGDGTIDLNDTVGFALGTTSGLPASGMLYTTSVTIIDRKMDASKGDYTYKYPGVQQYGDNSFGMSGDTYQVSELVQFCNNLSDLMDATGVITVSTEDAKATGYGSTDLLAIRNRFTSGNMLFGGIVTLGSLEYSEYRDMNAGGSGYAIFPVPLYRSGSNDKYLTQIHSLATVGAISYATDKFAQCTAYLNYQSTHSSSILNEYYNFKLVYDVVGSGFRGNVEMLNYLRYNVRSSFDRTFEDAVAYYRLSNGGVFEAPYNKWNTLLKDNNFKIDDMYTTYSRLAPKKALALYQLENELYPTLPD